MPTADQGGTASRSGQARGWLKSAAAPGRTFLWLAAGCQALETVFTVVQWAALAWAAMGGDAPPVVAPPALAQPAPFIAILVGIGTGLAAPPPPSTGPPASR